MKNYQAVLFDMDGLMFDTERLARKELYRALEDMGLNPDMDFLYGLVGRDRNEVRRRMLSVCGSEENYHEVLRREVSGIVRYVQTNGTPLKKGLKKLLEVLQGAGVRKAVVSCSLESRVLPCIESSGLARMFDAVVTGEMVENGKPAPDAYLLAAKALNVQPAECLVLEDSVTGGVAGLNAGMDVVLVPDTVLPSESEAARFLMTADSLLDVIPLFRPDAGLR